eukprot:403337354
MRKIPPIQTTVIFSQICFNNHQLDDTFENNPSSKYGVDEKNGMKKAPNGFITFSGNINASTSNGIGASQSQENSLESLKEMEMRLFGVKRDTALPRETSIPDQEFIPIKTGTGVKLMKNGPNHIMDATEFEPLFSSSSRKLMNRVVYDSVDPAPNHLANQEQQVNQQQPVTSNVITNANLNEGDASNNGLASNDNEENDNFQPNPNQWINDAVFTNYYSPKSADDYTLVFESRFESGNLRRAIQVYEFEYDLILKPDYNTRGHTQWFYFRVQNMKAGRTYRFNIINLLKPDSLYNHGMKPLMYSDIEAKKYSKGWHRDGKDVCYYQNSMKRKTVGHYYTLTFSIKRKTMCYTLAGNPVDLLIITTFPNPNTAASEVDYQQIKQRKGIVISSRVHPGETGAQFMMKGIIDYLVGNSIGARVLRDNFVFKIVPMLNPDGVINGNTRCSLAGVDLNRQWIEPSKKVHPTIYNTKMMMKKFQEDREVFLFCDIHGHSRKKNIFMYGNSGKNDKYKERIFPYLLDKLGETFNFNDCAFAVQKSKESTARVVGWKELGITNSFTLEASFCGADFGQYSDLHFNTDMLQQIGHRFCETIIEYCMMEPHHMKNFLEDIENIVNNSNQNTQETQPINGQSDQKQPFGGLENAENQNAFGGYNGFLNEVSGGGMLGTIKDEDSNADSDFSNDDGPSNIQSSAAGIAQLKQLESQPQTTNQQQSSMNSNITPNLADKQGASQIQKVKLTKGQKQQLESGNFDLQYKTQDKTGGAIGNKDQIQSTADRNAGDKTESKAAGKKKKDGGVTKKKKKQ